MSTDRRWVLIEILPCPGSITVSGAGTEAVNGTYCPDGMENGWAVWTKVGGTRLEDSIYRAFYDSGSGLEDLGYFIMTSGGSFEDDPLNALYSTYGTPGTPFMTWDIYGSFGPGGAAPGPRSRFYADREPVTRKFGPLQYARFSEEEDLSVGLIKKRRKLTTDIVFTGDDFDYFRSIEKDATRRCEELIIRRQWRCDGMWKTIWTGTFSTGSGKWDFDKCEFTVRAVVLDDYSCIIGKQKQKFNILQVGTQLNVTKLVPLVDFLVCTSNNPEDGLLCEEIGPDPLTPLNAGGWEYLDDVNDTIGGIPTTFYFYWRERITTECIDGVAVPPPGTSWVLYVDECSVNGTAQYVRPTQGAYPYSSPPTQGTYDGDGNPVAPNGDCLWIFVGNARAEGTTDVFAPYFVCTDVESEADIHLDRGRLLKEVVEFFLQKMGCPTTELVSDFFEWNPEGDAPGYVAGYNYVTGLPNQMTHLLIYQKSDIIDYASSNPATIGELTFEELMKFFRVAHRVYWFIDSLGRFRLEHWTYFNEATGLDLTTGTETTEPLAYEHRTDEIPAVERAIWMDAQGRDFVGLDIVYSGPCVNAELPPMEWAAGRFSTDLNFVINPANDLSNDGFVVLACNKLDTTYYTIVDYGAISDNYVTNAPMSWANLQDAFWRSDRYRPTGEMNGVETTFDAYLPNIEQRGVVVHICCGYPDFDSGERVRTKLGYRIGVPLAFVRKAEFDEQSEDLTLTLRYAL